MTSSSRIASRHVQTLTVIDPDLGAPVEVEIRKLESGAMLGIDGSYLDQDVGPVWSAYDKGVEVVVPDDEKPKHRASKGECASVYTDAEGTEKCKMGRDHDGPHRSTRWITEGGQCVWVCWLDAPGAEDFCHCPRYSGMTDGRCDTCDRPMRRSHGQT